MMADGDDAPLAGVRVVDLSRLLPGPFCTQMLVDLGAEVIKVEDGGAGDYTRHFPPAASDGQGAAFHALNRGKKSVVIDLKSAEGKESFLKLVRTANVVVESFRPGVLDRLGLGPAALLEARPGLVVCSISGYGQTGPDALRAGHDINYLARAGVLGMVAAPAPLPVQVADLAGGAFPAAVQILAALRRSERTGRGSVVDVSMADASYALMAMPLARAAAGEGPIGGGRDMLVDSPCYAVYGTSDGGHVAVGALEPKFWLPLVRALGMPELATAQFAAGEEGRRVRAALSRAFAARTAAEWRAFLEPLDTCTEVVNAPGSARRTDRQMASRPLTVRVRVGNGQELDLPRSPLNMTGARFSALPAPQHGQHTDEILSRL